MFLYLAILLSIIPQIEPHSLFTCRIKRYCYETNTL